MKLKTIPLEYSITPNQRRHVRRWVTELRSGKWRQGFGQLCNDQEGYCCLGVCSEIAKGVKRFPRINGYSFVYPGDPDGDRFSGHPYVEWFRSRFGFDYVKYVAFMGYGSHTVRNLPALNNAGVPFDVIADVIEAAILKRKETVITYE